MSDQEVTMNDVERDICEKNHFRVEAHGDGYILTDRDPALLKKKIKLPKHRGTNLGMLIMLAKREQDARNKVAPVETVETLDAVVETVSETAEIVESVVVETVVETVEIEDEVLETEDEPEEDEDETPTNVVSLRRVVITPDEMTEIPSILKDVILDDTGKKPEKTPTVKKERKHQDNRFARSFRAILENPDLTVAEQAAIAQVTPAMHGWYEIVLRSLYKIIYEKHGEDVIPMLPKLIKK